MRRRWHPRSPYLVWGAAMAVYVVAVTGRTSLGVAGLEAAERFGADAATLSLFVVVQLAVYAAAQIPVGLLLDRVGSRRLLAVGAIVLATGQLGLALAETVPTALAARVLIGLGDATAFVPVLRLLPAWFPPRRVPLMTQATGMLGQTGQIVSAIPFLALLSAAGWVPAFAALAAAGLVVAVLAAAVVRNEPEPRAEAVATGPTATGPDRPGAGVALREPGAWLGFTTHAVCMFSGATFFLLWGVPFLVAGQGLGRSATAGLLTLGAVAGIVTGPVTAVLVARHPLRRTWLVIGAVTVTALAWASVLVPATPRPLWHLVVLVLSLTVSMTASTIGFDFARTFVPAVRLGTATGLVNVGGFAATLVSVFLVGLVLDLVAPDGVYGLDDFRTALAVQGALWVAGLVALVLLRRAARARMAARGEVVPPVREVLARRRELSRRRRGGRRRTR